MSESDPRGAEITIGDLLAYRRGELSEQRAEKVRDRLAADPDWADLYLDLARAEELEEAGSDVDDETIEREWRRLEKAVAPGGRLLPFRRWVASHPLHAVAASFLVAVLATSALLRLPAAPEATGRVAFLELEPVDEHDQMRGGNEITIERETEVIVLEIYPPTTAKTGRDTPSSCRFELRQGGRAITTGEAALQTRGAYLLTLSPDLLGDQTTEIRLFELDPPASQPFATYKLSLGKAP